MEHAVGVVGLGHAFGQAADGKEAAEEAIDGQVRGHRCYRALLRSWLRAARGCACNVPC